MLKHKQLSHPELLKAVDASGKIPDWCVLVCHNRASNIQGLMCTIIIKSHKRVFVTQDFMSCICSDQMGVAINTYQVPSLSKFL